MMGTEESGEVRALADDERVLRGLRAGDEAAFLALVDRHHGAMVRVARLLLAPGPAEEVVRNAWEEFVAMAPRLEIPPALRTWLFGGLVGCARRHAEREGLPLDLARSAPEPALPPSRFQPADGRYADNWAEPPRPWSAERLEEAGAVALERGLARLPAAERASFALREIAGFEPAEASGILGTSEAQHRALLHRARSKLREAIDEAMRAGGEGKP